MTMNTNNSISVLARRAPWASHIQLMVMQRLDVGVAYGTRIEMQVVTEASVGLLPEPTLTIDYTAAQRLMDELWECGLRPSEGMGSAGQLAAIQRHLEDLRRLVFEEKSDERK